MTWYPCHCQGTDSASPVWCPAWPVSFLISLHHFAGFTYSTSPYYTCQLFLRYKGEIFILGVLGFFKTTRSFPKIPEEARKSSEVFRTRPKSAEGEVFTCFSLQKSEIARKVLSFIHFTRGFRSLHGSELTYFWKSCQARRQQLTFFNQAWEIGPQAWDRSFQPAGVRLTPKAWELAGIPYYDSSGTLLFLQRIAPYFSRVGKLLSSSPAE